MSPTSGGALHVTFTKGCGVDDIHILRACGGEVRARLAQKGPVPHDAVHLFVEQELGLRRGFWGMVYEGRHPDELAGLARASGHASAKRAEEPCADWIEIIQAERIVEAFEADHWSGGCGDVQALRDMAASGCWQSHVPSLDLSNDHVARIRWLIAAFQERWLATKVGASQTLIWNPAP